MGAGFRSRGLSPTFHAVASCLSYAICSIALTLANKAIFSSRALNYPWTLLSIQSIFSFLLLGAFYTLRDRTCPIKPRLLSELAKPCAVFALYLFTNARALRHISLPLLSVLKSLAPMGIALSERLLYNEHLSAGTYAAMSLIILSNLVTLAADVEFHFWGYIWAAANALLNVLYVVSLRYYVTNNHTAGQKTLHNNLLLVFLTLPTALYTNELPSFLHEFALTSTRFRALLLLSCLLAVGIGASVFWVLSATSGSTLSFVGGANKVLVIILGAILFEVHISPAGWAGVALGGTASISFSVSKAMSARAAKAAQMLPASLLASDKDFEVLTDSSSSTPSFAYTCNLSSRISVRSVIAEPEAKLHNADLLSVVK